LVVEVVFTGVSAFIFVDTIAKELFKKRKGETDSSKNDRDDKSRSASNCEESL